MVEADAYDYKEMEANLLTNIELRKFNWGAAGLNFIWGIFNGSFLNCLSSFMVIVFFIGLILLTVENKISAVLIYVFYVIYLGVRGNKWAWEHHKWDNLQRFSIVQQRWNIAGLIAFGIFYLIPTISFLCIYLIVGDAIFEAFDKLKIQDKDTTAVELFLSDANVTSAANSDALIDYLVNKKSEVSQNKYIQFDRNTVRVESSIFAPEDEKTDTLYTFKKVPLCKIKDKNCYIVSYRYVNGNITPISKIYFDSVGRYKYVKIVTKDKI